MINGKRVLAIIPARGGSKGIKKKNIVNLNGKPLISYTIIAAIKSSFFDRVVVSTDSDEIAKISVEYGADVPFLRPKELSNDNSKTIDVMMHTLNSLESEKDSYDIVVLLQPSSPLRNEQHIIEAMNLFIKNSMKGLVSICEVEENPIFMRRKINGNKLEKIINMQSTIRRQDLETFYKVNGAIYINTVEELSKETSLNDNEIGYIMEKKCSIDIDKPEDLKRTQELIDG